MYNNLCLWHNNLYSIFTLQINGKCNPYKYDVAVTHLAVQTLICILYSGLISRGEIFKVFVDFVSSTRFKPQNFSHISIE